jgi:hypothetical protein
MWFIGKPIVYIGVSIWVFIHRNDSSGNRVRPLFQTKIARFFSFVFAAAMVLLMVFISEGYIMDIPNLLTGKYRYVEGTPQKIWHKSKTFDEYVQINGVKIEFPFSSTLAMGKYYQVKYLPHSGYGLDAKEIEKK